MSIIRKIRRIIFLLRKKGWRYAWNLIHFNLFFGTKNPLVLKLLYWLEPYPSYLEIETTTRCNLKCIMCEHTYWKEQNRDMTFEQFKYIVDQFPKLKWLGLTGIGESFLNKDFLKMLEYVKEKDVFVELYDNFCFLDEGKIRQLIKLGVDKIFISLDASTKETYEKIRVGSDFNKVVDNLKTFFRVKKEMKAYFPQLAFHFIVNKLNLPEIPQYIELAGSISQGEKIVVHFTRMLHEFKEVKDLFAEIPEQLIKLASEKAKTYGIKAVWNADVPSRKPSVKKCSE